MTHLKLASKSMEIADSQNATHLAYENVLTLQSADKHSAAAARRLEKTAARLTDAMENLELLVEKDYLIVPAADDVHAALALIMEAQQLLAAAHARVR